MAQVPEFRETLPGDLPALGSLYPRAFPDEDLLPLVRQLMRLGPEIMSLTALVDNAIAGHVLFTTCGLERGAARIALLGPLATVPDRRRQGIGGALIRAGLQRLRDAGTALVCVLGDPAYYGRHGFSPETGVTPPYALPVEWQGAWQSLHLGGDALLSGRLAVPGPWRDPVLWAP